MSSTKATLVTRPNKATLVTKPNVATLVTRPNRATVSGSPGLIGQSVGFWRADHYDAGADVLSDLSGAGRHARLGSAVGADASDPVRLVPVGGKRYLWLPGSAGNFAQIPDHPSFDVSGVLELVTYAKPITWNATEMGGRGPFSATGAFGLYTGTNIFQFAYRRASDGINVFVVGPSSVGVLVDGQAKWIKVTRDPATGVVTWYVSDDGVNWGSAIGSVNGVAEAIQAGTAPFRVSELGLGVGRDLGQTFRVWTKDGGSTFVDIDFTDPDITEPFNSFVESTGKTVTINRSASGLVSTVVDRPMLVHDGAASYSEVPDHGSLDFAAAAPFSVAAAVRPQDATPAAAQVLLAKKTNLTTGAGYALYIDPTGVPKCVIADGTNSVVATGPALPGDRRAAVVAAVRDPVTDKLTVYTDGVAGTPVTDTTTGAISNAEVLRLGRLSGAGTSYLWGELFGAGVWNKALIPSDVAALSGIMKLTPA